MSSSESQSSNDHVVKQNTRGDNVGEATPSLTLKHLWHKELLRREKVRERRISLKAFVHLLVAEGNQVAQQWLFSKKSAYGDKRSDKNIALSRTSAQASKSARRKGKSSGGRPSS